LRSVASLAELPPQPALSVIINCGTKWVTSLALAAARANTEWPVLLIDCESRDGSREHFASLSKRHGLDFYWLDWPLRRHGMALDALFRDVPAERVLLVDSDLEILEKHLVEAMDGALRAREMNYGAGFLHRAQWMGAAHGLPDRVALYAERMWIPLVLLRTAAVRQALARGTSFAQQRMFLEWPGHPTLSRWLGYRHWIPGLRGLARGNARDPGDPPPRIVEYDTGARMHAALLDEGYAFAALDEGRWGDVRHYHGASRSRLTARLRDAARRLGTRRAKPDAGDDARARLKTRYGID
jgi:hypothetical protein